MKKWLQWIALYADRFRYELRDPYDVDGNKAWAEAIDRRYAELQGMR